MKLLLVNGPNLNLLGTREPEKYGKTTLQDIEKQMTQKASLDQHSLLCFQSNSEGALIDFIHNEAKTSKAMILNPGAYTHTSIALRDAILSVALPFIEVHITNVYQREAFRHHSYFKDIAIGQIIGLGIDGYFLAYQALASKLQRGEL
ncbi:MAG TPA: type II 3-dehydroquinate dehydratase [Spirochaetia bacterium]|nr:MAG: type II 3-dehydroquinate dehydratase [Spirochaetes bacterium GWB1_36_13]HCL55673.1 type II 3-dehydroquinate dehydratase [Spirochaetia bacterium]